MTELLLHECKCGAGITLRRGERSTCDVCGCIYCLDVSDDGDESEPLLVEDPQARDTRDIMIAGLRDVVCEEAAMVALSGGGGPAEIQRNATMLIALLLDRLVEAVEAIPYDDPDSDGVYPGADEEDEHGQQ